MHVLGENWTESFGEHSDALEDGILGRSVLLSVKSRRDETKKGFASQRLREEGEPDWRTLYVPSHGKTLLDGSENTIQERIHLRADLVRDVTDGEEGWKGTRPRGRQLPRQREVSNENSCSP